MTKKEKTKYSEHETTDDSALTVIPLFAISFDRGRETFTEDSAPHNESSSEPTSL